MLQAEQGHKYAKAAPFCCCMDTKQMDRLTKLLLRKRVPLSTQTAPIWLSSAPSLGKKMKFIFKPYPVFLNTVIAVTAWCAISLSAVAHSESHWTIPSGAQKDTLPPLASIPLLQKMGTPNPCTMSPPQTPSAVGWLGRDCTIQLPCEGLAVSPTRR